ncbi:MAG TPA: undecaprenyldiphospho-muramoylpentapeptide beta-N-acetylglucosaminyltransferase [Thermodesulfobacteriota bacterium]|nr:undecaprenyldiphospho-muramoylpentapeptide beta-N-acetylglucosaminyltransferase [Thermodesulfobacteriota bacterium]
MKCVIAGGGTGGHLFPGMAIAEAFVEREKGNEVLFIGTEKGIEARVLQGGKFPLRTIQAKPIQGRSFLEKIKAVWSLPKATSEACAILREFQPQIVLGVGGYASGPALLAAFLLGMKRAIQEQNVMPGMTNRILKWFSHRIFVSFEEAKEYFPERKVLVTGNPIRKAFFAALGEDRREEKESDRFTLLIFGGSAGARRINRAMIESLGDLQGIRTSLKIVHQTGKEDLEFVSEEYRRRGFEALVRPFFEDLPVYYRIADLVVCRSGAGTVAELAVSGRAALLIPYPYAAHQHQRINAKKLADLGAATMILDQELDGKTLAQAILHLYGHPEEREKMEAAIGQLARPRAAEEIVDHCYRLVAAGRS